MKIVVIIIIVTVIIVCSIIDDRCCRKRARKHVAGRSKLSDSEFGRRYFSEDRALIAIQLRYVLAGWIPIDISQVLPSDRIVTDFHIDKEDFYLDILSHVEDKFCIKISIHDRWYIETFQDLVECVARKLEAEVRKS